MFLFYIILWKSFMPTYFVHYNIRNAFILKLNLRETTQFSYIWSNLMILN